MGDFKLRYLPFKELPQNIIGRIVSRRWKKELVLLSEREKEFLYGLEELIGYKIYISTYYSHKNHKWLKWMSGGSFGKYICLNNAHDLQTLRHEKGHGEISKELGWLYIPCNGIPSVCGNLYDRVAHENWTYKERIKWYYEQPWEKKADEKGKVKRPWRQ